MVTHFSILAWKIPWTEESRGSQRVRHDWAHTHTHNKNIIYFSVLLCKTFFWIFIYYILKIAEKNKVKKNFFNPGLMAIPKVKKLNSIWLEPTSLDQICHEEEWVREVSGGENDGRRWEKRGEGSSVVLFCLSQSSQIMEVWLCGAGNQPGCANGI